MTDTELARVPPLVLDVPGPARDAFANAIGWVRLLLPPFGGEEAAKHFSFTLDREMPALCQDIAERLASGSNLPRPDEEASIAFARPTFRHIFTTGVSNKRRRRQTAGVWFLYYTLPGGNVLRIMGLRHSASEPLTAQFDRPFTDSE